MNDIKKEIMAGAVIALGGMGFLSIDNKVLGAFLFSIGLMLVCTREYRLYTGKIPYISPKYNPIMPYARMLVMNLLAAFVMAFIFRTARPDLINKATEICTRKFSEGWRVILLGMMCNVFIYFAVDGMKQRRESAHSLLILVLCVMGFILTGTEHCIANAFYIGVSGSNIGHGLLFLGLNILGNTLGGILAYRIDRIGER